VRLEVIYLTYFKAPFQVRFVHGLVLVLGFLLVVIAALKELPWESDCCLGAR
jgi:hypothetical protein